MSFMIPRSLPHPQLPTPHISHLHTFFIQGALLCLAAATVGLGEPTEAHLRQIVPPVLHSFTDQDSRVRYYACEALYNIAKVRSVHLTLCAVSGCSAIHTAVKV